MCQHFSGYTILGNNFSIYRMFKEAKIAILNTQLHEPVTYGLLAAFFQLIVFVFHNSDRPQYTAGPLPQETDRERNRSPKFLRLYGRLPTATAQVQSLTERAGRKKNISR